MASARGGWLPAAITMACVGAALALVEIPAVGAAVSRPALITVLAGLVLVSVGVSLFWSMGLKQEGVAVRLIILVPIALSVLFTVALMLDAQIRGPGPSGGAG